MVAKDMAGIFNPGYKLLAHTRQTWDFNLMNFVFHERRDCRFSIF